MGAGSVLSSSSFNPPKTLFSFISKTTSSARPPQAQAGNGGLFSFISKTTSSDRPPQAQAGNGGGQLPFPTLPLTIHNPSSAAAAPPPPSNFKDTLPRIDRSGKFCSPRAARELALMVLYAACLEGSDPIRLFEKRLNSSSKEIGYEFDSAWLTEYDHMSFGGPPLATQTIEEANAILQDYEKESHIEAQVLSAHPKLVYSKLILLFTRKLLGAVAENWETSVMAIDKVAPENWKKEPASRILEFSLLHLAMSEIAVVGTRHQIVINEAVDLAKRFCDGAAPRIINGCMRTFLKEKHQHQSLNVVSSCDKQLTQQF